MRFATVGDNTIDEYVGAQELSFVGGNAINVAVRLAELGNEVAYFGAVGPDERGARIRSALAERGVSIQHLLEIPGVTSTSQVRVAPDGDRQLSSEEFGTCVDYRPTERELAVLAGCAVVHIGWTPFAGEVREALAGRGVVVAQDCAVAEGYDHLDIAFCSAGEDEETGRSLARDAIGGGARFAVVTRGAAGSLAFDGAQWWSRDAEVIEAVDTTGAGDSFIAGFLSAWSRGRSVESCLTVGTVVAAQTCQHRGGFMQVPIRRHEREI
jgi:fructoselysine 6-kinase